MLLRGAIYLLAGAAIVAFWYFGFCRYNRRKFLQVLRWIDAALSGHGHIVGIQWLAPSSLLVRMRISPHLFRHATVVVQLLPRELPFKWLLNRWRSLPETITFEADLDYPPGFNLEVRNHRWCGGTRRKVSPMLENWEIEHGGAFVITTRNDWQRDITNMMNALMASRERDFLSVCFRRSSPHFSATVPLHSISPHSTAGPGIFEVLSELAGGASASLF